MSLQLGSSVALYIVEVPSLVPNNNIEDTYLITEECENKYRALSELTELSGVPFEPHLRSGSPHGMEQPLLLQCVKCKPNDWSFLRPGAVTKMGEGS